MSLARTFRALSLSYDPLVDLGLVRGLLSLQACQYEMAGQGFLAP
jgi:hypothetical protein